jgi:hypothetical protein
MKLPEFFLADMPPEAVLTPDLVRDACLALKQNRERYLRHRSTESLIRILSDAAAIWLESNSPFRESALELGPAITGFSKATLARGLDSFFTQLTAKNLEAFIEQELGHSRRLDEFSRHDCEHKSGRSSMARGPELIAHICAGNIPNSTLMNMVLGVLLRSAQFVKCASGTSYLPRLFAHTLHELDPKLGACLEIAEWPGGSDLENPLFDESGLVTATGSDETLVSIRKRLSLKTRLIEHGHRMSFGFVTHKAFRSRDGDGIVKEAAASVAAWDQLGCLSPHVIYVETGGGSSAEVFAESLARELEELEKTQPRAPIPTRVSAAIASRRSFFEIRAAHAMDTRCWFSPGSTAWSVVYELDARFLVSCLHRFIHVKGVENLTEALHGADDVRRHVSTVGLACLPEQRPELTKELADWGAPRICPLGRMQHPPLFWRHDGRPSLAELVTWIDLES